MARIRNRRTAPRALGRLMPALVLAACTAAPAPQTAPAATPPPSPPPAPSPAAPAGVPLATIGGETITVDDFNREMERRGGRQPGRFATAEQRRALLDEMVRDRAVVAAARAAGAESDPEFRAAVERILRSTYLRTELDPKVNAVDATNEEIAAYYAAHADEFRTPARRRAAWVFLELPTKASAETRTRIRKRLEEARTKAAALGAAESLGEVARNYSQDPSTRYTGGELGWLYLDQADSYRWGGDVVRTIFALPEVGALSPIREHEKGLYFLKLVADEPAAPTPIEKLRGGIRSRILTEKRDAARDAFYADLLARTPVSVDAAKLAAIPPLAPPAVDDKPPSLPRN